MPAKHHRDAENRGEQHAHAHRDGDSVDGSPDDRADRGTTHDAHRPDEAADHALPISPLGHERCGAHAQNRRVGDADRDHLHGEDRVRPFARPDETFQGLNDGEHPQIHERDREATRAQKSSKGGREPRLVVREPLHDGNEDVEDRGREESAGLDRELVAEVVDAEDRRLHEKFGDHVVAAIEEGHHCGAEEKPSELSQERPDESRPRSEVVPGRARPDPEEQDLRDGSDQYRDRERGGVSEDDREDDREGIGEGVVDDRRGGTGAEGEPRVHSSPEHEPHGRDHHGRRHDPQERDETGRFEMGRQRRGEHEHRHDADEVEAVGECEHRSGSQPSPRGGKRDEIGERIPSLKNAREGLNPDRGREEAEIVVHENPPGDDLCCKRCDSTQETRDEHQTGAACGVLGEHGRGASGGRGSRSMDRRFWR